MTADEGRSTEYVIMVGPHKRFDEEVFFGNRDGSIGDESEIVHLPSNSVWADILVPLGIFKSRGEAWRNGWRDIPFGFTDQSVGKFRRRISTLRYAKPPKGNLCAIHD